MGFFKGQDFPKDVILLILFISAWGVRIRSYSGPYFPAPYAVRMRENSDQNNSEYGHFLRNVIYVIYSD